MKQRTFEQILVTILVALAGCVGGTPAETILSESSGTTGLAPGSLAGLITDDEFRPLEGVRVSLNGTSMSTTSDGTGGYRIDGVPAGTWDLIAEAPLYEPAQRALEVRPAEEIRVDLQLPRGPDLRPHNLTTTFQGSYECAHEIPFWTGDCMLLYNNITGQNDTYTRETYAFRLPVNLRWESVVVELKWDSPPNNQFDGMRVYLENANGTPTGHSYKVGRTDGAQSPLRFVVNRGEPHPRADTYDGTSTKAFIPDGGEAAQIRVFPQGKLYNESCTVGRTVQGRCWLGVGAGLDIDFTVHATVFYNEREPEGFSYLAKA